MTDVALPLVSVVTPFYNTEAYLPECVESVLRQTYPNFELVLVDNCSTDRSLEIVESCASRDSRVRIVRNSVFLTQTENLNHSLEQISPASVYVKILQADDFLFPTCLAEMVAVAQEHPSVGVVGAYTLLGWKDRGNVYLDGLPFRTFFPGKEIGRQFILAGQYVTGSPSSTMIRSDIVRSRKPFYSLSSPVEDVDAPLEILQAVDFGFVHQVLTYTRRDNESIISALRTFNMMLLAELIAVRRYGPAFLSPRELGQRLRELESRYYLMLGEGLWRGQSRKFWEFHRAGLRWSGRDLQVGKVMIYSVLAALRRLLNPWDLIAGILRRLSRR